MSGVTLTDFLLARIAEDEQNHFPYWHRLDCPVVDSADAECACASGVFIKAECEAKRRIVELSWDHFGEDDYAWGMEEAKRQVLVLLALPYADHADYDEAWRP